MEVRVASIQDAEAILAIYAPYVEKTNMMFLVLHKCKDAS